MLSNHYILLDASRAQAGAQRRYICPLATSHLTRDLRQFFCRDAMDDLSVPLYKGTDAMPMISIRCTFIPAISLRI